MVVHLFRGPGSHRTLIKLFNNSTNGKFRHEVCSLLVTRSFCATSPQSLLENVPPFVDPNLSYTYGRTTGSFIYKTVNQSLTEIANNNPNRLAVVSVHQEIEKTYQQFTHDVNMLSKSLIGMGLRKGDVAGSWSGNIYEYMVVQHALGKLGVINASFSPMYKQVELQHALNKSRMKMLFMPGVDTRQESLNQFQSVILDIDLKETNLQQIVLFEQGDKEIPKIGSLQVTPYDQIAYNNDGVIPEEVTSQVVPEDPCSIYFTSGTTGKPKGAVLTHFAIVNNIRNVMAKLDAGRQQDVIVNPLPFFHVFAGVVACYGMSVTPSTYILPSLKYTARAVVQTMEKYNCNFTMMVPAMIVDILNYCQHKNIHLPTLEKIVTGAAPCPVEVVNSAKRQFTNIEKIYIGYGSTETTAVATAHHRNTPQEVLTDSVGVALPFTEIKVVDLKTRELVKHGETGEILIRGFHIMKGYLDDPEKTAEIMDKGWYMSGDMGTLDKDGVVRITGRCKELIIRGGSNIYPKEIEELLMTHPDIMDIQVCGVPDKRNGEEVCAWIKLNDPNKTVSEGNIRSFCRDRISYYKIPKYILFVTEFPSTASGKVQKFKMTQQTIEKLNLKDK